VRSLTAKIDAQGDHLTAKIDAQGDRLDAKIDAQTNKLLIQLPAIIIAILGLFGVVMKFWPAPVQPTQPAPITQPAPPITTDQPREGNQ